MSDLILYLTMAIIGYFAGSKLREQQTLLLWTGKLQTAAIILLIFTMGMRMGANPEVIDNLNSIGLYALIMTVSIMFFSAAAMTAARKIMGIDRFGNLKKKEENRKVFSDESAAETVSDEGQPEKEKKISSMTVIILLCVVSGLAFGHLCVPQFFSDVNRFADLAGSLINIGLCVLLFFVGFDMGVDGVAIRHFRRVGLRVLAFPFIIMLGSLVGAGVCALFLPLSLRECLAVGGGFGWYSFAPGIILEAGLVTAGAVSFMHNVMRELLSVLLIPLAARHIGYLEAVAMPACSSMDVCLPIIERSTRSDIAVYAFISGVVESLAVPVVVPFLLG